MSSFISYLISGISLGSVYAIIALGYTMVYGIAKMLNFAHGDVIMVGSYVVYVAVSGMGLNPILAILLSIIICTLMGVVIEGVAYRPLRNAASPLAVLITAIGVSYLLQNVALLIWGADTKSFSNVISLPSLKLAGGSIVITGVTIVTIIGGILIMAGLMLFISKTKTGQAMLAVSEDKGAAQRVLRPRHFKENPGKQNNLHYFCNRFRTCSNRRCASLLCIPVFDTIYRCYAWYQSIRCSCIWRYRIYPGSLYRRCCSGYPGDFW